MLKIPWHTNIYFVIHKHTGNRLRFIDAGCTSFLTADGIYVGVAKSKTIYFTSNGFLLVNSLVEASRVLNTDKSNKGGTDSFKHFYKLVLVSNYDRKLKDLYGL